jgi:hypothetical protein
VNIVKAVKWPIDLLYGLLLLDLKTLKSISRDSWGRAFGWVIGGSFEVTIIVVFVHAKFMCGKLSKELVCISRIV